MFEIFIFKTKYPNKAHGKLTCFDKTYRLTFFFLSLYFFVFFCLKNSQTVLTMNTKPQVNTLKKPSNKKKKTKLNSIAYAPTNRNRVPTFQKTNFQTTDSQTFEKIRQFSPSCALGCGDPLGCRWRFAWLYGIQRR